MPEFFVFLMKVNAALILFCLAYYLILRKLTFYTLNRFFLLAGIVFSSLYPFVDPMVLFEKHEALLKPIESALPVIYVAVTDAGFDYWMLARFVFWTGVFLMSFRLLIRLYSLYQVHRQSVRGRVSEYEVRLLKGNISTFSFWQNIYLNPGLHQPKELDAVLEHEQVHVQEWHTIDILMAELTAVFYWFNPGVWYTRKAIKENIEFITDQQILKRGVDRKAYQYSMIHTLTAGNPSVLMNNFNITGIKRRIIMMNSRKSSGIQLIRYVFLLPVLLLLTTAFTLFKTDIKANLGFQDTLKRTTTLPSSYEAEKPAVAFNKIVHNGNEGQTTSKIAGGTGLQKKVNKENPGAEATISTNEADTGARITKFKIRQIHTEEINGDGTPKVTRVMMVKRSGPATMQLTNTDSVKVLVIRGKNKETDPLQESFPGADPDMKIYIDEVEVPVERMKELNPLDIERVNIQKNDQYPNTKGIRIYTKTFKKLVSP